MKSLKYFIILLIVLLVLLYFNFVKPNNSEIVKDVNTASLQEDIVSSKNNNKQLPSKVKIPETPKQNPNQPKQEIRNPVKKSELDYITAFRDWNYFLNCYTDVEDFESEKDPLLTLSERFSYNYRESQTEPTHQQNMYYLHHVEICKTLISESNSEGESFYQIRANLKQRFDNIIPKTAEEKELQRALEMVEQLGTFRSSLSKAYYPKPTLPVDEIDSLRIQMMDLSNLIMEIYDGNEVLSSEQTQLINQYNNEISQLSLIIENSKLIDLAKINKKISTIDGYLNSMDDYIKKIQSPDAFLLISNALYRPEYFSQDSTVISSLKAKTGIYDSYYIQILNKIVLPLVACSMDYPCDAQSDLITNYCLGLSDSMFNQACGLSLEDFYFSFYIGANQLNDVNNYFSYLVNRYAY